MDFAYTSPCVSKCAFMRSIQIAAPIILHFRRLRSPGLSALKCWLIYKHAMFRASPCVSKCAFMPSCRCAHQLNAASVPSQAFMLSGLLLPSIRIQISLVNENVLQISLATLNPQQIRDTFLNIRNRIQTQQCKFVLVRKRSCSVD